jgi:hypothetical protein
MTDCLCADPGLRPPFTELDRRLATLDVRLMTSPIFVVESGDGGDNFKASRSDALIVDRFPRHVAEALMAGEKVS